MVREYAEMYPDLYERACLVEDTIKHKWKRDFGINDLMSQKPPMKEELLLLYGAHF